MSYAYIEIVKYWIKLPSILKSLLNTGTSIGSILLTLYITIVLPNLEIKYNVFLYYY